MELARYAQHFKRWDRLSEAERDFFVGDEYLPLNSAHAERIEILQGHEAREFIREALHKVPGYSPTATSAFVQEKHITIIDVWNDKAKIQEVRDWLYHTGVPFSRRVFLLYDNRVVSTDWKIVVKYWDALAWNVGVEMLALDESKTWVCSFHHEDVITFRSYFRLEGIVRRPA